MGDASLSAVQKRQLQRDAEKEQVKNVASRFRSLVREADAIPLRAKTQYPTYIEGRTLHLLRGVAEAEGISVQELIRTSIREGLEKRLAAVPKEKKAPAKKRTAKKRT